MRSTIVAAGVVLALGAGASMTAFAQAKPDVLVKQRQAAMTLQGKYLGPIGAMLKGSAPYNADIVARNATFLENLARVPWDGFDPSTRGEKSRTRPEAFADVLQKRPGFARWAPGAHRLFAEATLRADPARGDWALACPRDHEAHIFATNTDPTIWPRAREIGVPLRLIGADVDLPGQQAPALLTAAMAADQGLDYVMIRDTTHFLQIEAPAAVRDATVAFLDRAGFARVDDRLDLLERDVVPLGIQLLAEQAQDALGEERQEPHDRTEQPHEEQDRPNREKRPPLRMSRRVALRDHVAEDEDERRQEHRRGRNRQLGPAGVDDEDRDGVRRERHRGVAHEQVAREDGAENALGIGESLPDERRAAFLLLELPEAVAVERHERRFGAGEKRVGADQHGEKHQRGEEHGARVPPYYRPGAALESIAAERLDSTAPQLKETS